jgi:hypothetical protein
MGVILSASDLRSRQLALSPHSQVYATLERVDGRLKMIATCCCSRFVPLSESRATAKNSRVQSMDVGLYTVVPF